MQRRKSEANLQIPCQESPQKSSDDKLMVNGNGPAAITNGRTEGSVPGGEGGLRTQIELISKLAMKGKSTC